MVFIEHFGRNDDAVWATVMARLVCPLATKVFSLVFRGARVDAEEGVPCERELVEKVGLLLDNISTSFFFSQCLQPVFFF